MLKIIATVFAYLMFNIAVWAALGKGGLIALAAANALGALITGIVYRKQLVGRPKWSVAALGSFGILAIVLGLRGSHAHFGSLNKSSLVAPLVYDGLLITSPSVMLLTGETISPWTLAVACGMCVITFMRYRHHTVMA